MKRIDLGLVGLIFSLIGIASSFLSIGWTLRGWLTGCR